MYGGRHVHRDDSAKKYQITKTSKITKKYLSEVQHVKIKYKKKQLKLDMETSKKKEQKKKKR